jgi:hypothetical protein
MSNPSNRIVKRLFALSNNVCAFPGCNSPISENSETTTGDMCHIKAKSPKGPRYDSEQTDTERNSFQNLILLCKRHHKIIDSDVNQYTVKKLKKMKKNHEVKGRIEINSTDSKIADNIIKEYIKINITNNKGTIIIDSPGAIKTEKITIKTNKQKIKLLPPEDAICHDTKMRGYALHLIKRYNEFSKNNPRRNSVYKYAFIYSKIEQEFGVTWEYIPKQRFEDLINFLQMRINKTFIGKINKSKGIKNYSSFDEFCAKKLKI